MILKIFIFYSLFIKDVCFVDFTYKREFENNQRSNLLTALEVIDTLKESIKKADNNKGSAVTALFSPMHKKISDDYCEYNNITNKSNNYKPTHNKEKDRDNIIYYNNSLENISNQTYDNQILQTEKNHLIDFDVTKNIQTMRKDYSNNNPKNLNKLIQQNLTLENEGIFQNIL